MQWQNFAGLKQRGVQAANREAREDLSHSSSQAASQAARARSRPTLSRCGEERFFGATPYCMATASGQTEREELRESDKEIYSPLGRMTDRWHFRRWSAVTSKRTNSLHIVVLFYKPPTHPPDSYRSLPFSTDIPLECFCRNTTKIEKQVLDATFTVACLQRFLMIMFMAPGSVAFFL